MFHPGSLLWRSRTTSSNLGLVLFRGPLAPTVADLGDLTRHGLEVTVAPPEPSVHWRLEIRHPTWGAASVFASRDAPPPPLAFIDWEPRLTPAERQLAREAGSIVTVVAEAPTGDVLRDRKLLLRFLDVIMGQHGLVGFDSQAEAFWSRAALAEELCHDADLDIAGLFTVHMVTDENDDSACVWLHTHGLQDIGFFEFDVLDPDPSCYGEGYDALRALAFDIVEGRARVDGRSLTVVEPEGSVRLIDARRFLARADAEAHPGWRDCLDDTHLDGHAIVCEPGPTMWPFGRAPRASRFFSSPWPEEGLIQFSDSASALMAERALQTYGLLRELVNELKEHGLPTLVKLGYPTDDGDSREHLWFALHEAGPDTIEGTLANTPFRVQSLQPGERGQHSIDLLSDWTILTPLGAINPRFLRPLRDIREDPDAFRSLLRQQESETEEGL